MHVIQEMLEYVQCLPEDFNVSEEDSVGEANALSLSAATLGDPAAPAVLTMKLRIQLQGRTLLF